MFTALHLSLDLIPTILVCCVFVGDFAIQCLNRVLCYFFGVKFFLVRFGLASFNASSNNTGSLAKIFLRIGFESLFEPFKKPYLTGFVLPGLAIY